MKKSRFSRVGFLCFWMVLMSLSSSSVWSIESPGLSLSIYTEDDRYQFLLGVPIKLTMVMKNVTGEPVLTERGFSMIELYRALAVTDPAGNTNNLDQGALGHIMPPPFFWKGESWSPAESLPGGFVQSQTINDIRELVPAMKTTPGWYTLEIRQQFIQFARTEVHSQIGLLGALDDQGNWTSALHSKKVQVFVAPQSGAHLRVQVLGQDAQPLAQVPVRMFKTSEIPAGSELEEIWLKSAQVSTGMTDFKGWVTWSSSGVCKSQDDYTAIAYYKGDYRSEIFLAGETGWAASDCSGAISKQIVFGGEIKWPISPFSIVAWNSIYLNSNAIVSSGNIGVLNASSGPWLNSRVEVSLGLNVRAQDGVQIYGDSVKIGWNASVDDVFYNDLIKQGVIRGEAKQGLSLPLPINLPVFPDFTPGTVDKTVKANRSMTLAPGNYRNVVVQLNGTLKLSGGEYNLNGLTLQSNAKLQFLGPTEVRITNRLSTAANVQMVPSGSGLGAKDLKLYVKGINGSNGALSSTPKAAALGDNNVLKCNFFVPNGTFSIGANANTTGSIIAKDISVGPNGRMTLASGF